MKKLLFIIALVAISSSITAQVGINTTQPKGALDVVSTNSGLIVPRVADINAVTAPVNGMILYDIYNKCIRAYEDNAWSDCYNGNVTLVPIPYVTSTTGKIWMDRNLGASKVATSSTDANSYGDLYQWGRGTDGHQLRTSFNRNYVATALYDLGHPDFIISPSSINDWRTPSSNDLWQGVNGINNPCPNGFRLPTTQEFQAESDAWQTSNPGAYFKNSPLKFPLAGRRETTGGFTSIGTLARYWTSTVETSGTQSYGQFISFNGSSTAILVNAGIRTGGNSVRCIKN